MNVEWRFFSPALKECDFRKWLYRWWFLWGKKQPCHQQTYYGTDIWTLNFLRNEPLPSTQDGFVSQLQGRIQMVAERLVTACSVRLVLGSWHLGSLSKTSMACRDNDTNKRIVLKIVLLIKFLILLPKKTFGLIWSQFWLETCCSWHLVGASQKWH